MIDKNESNETLLDEAEDRATENPSLGIVDGYEVHIAIRRDPEGAQIPDEFAVNLYIPQGPGDNIDIARVDTSRGTSHIDRLYLPEGDPQRKHDEGLHTLKPEGAVKYITEKGRWRDWVRRFDENHGLS
jgi:hypothetical protein